MKKYIWLLVLLLLVSGCKYLTPPITNISGADVALEKKQKRTEPDATKTRKVSVSIKVPEKEDQKEVSDYEE